MVVNGKNTPDMLSRIALVIFISVLFVTCTKTEYKSTESVFPNQTGNTWRYQFIPEGDTVKKQITVTITGEEVLSTGAHAKVWVYEFPGGIKDTQYVVSKNEKVTFFTRECAGCEPTYEKFRFEFPLEQEKAWISEGFTKVMYITNVFVPAGIFEGTYYITNNRPPAANRSLDNVTWFTPGIGITRYVQREMNPGPVTGNGHWLLESYTIQ